jgi:uncharacterized spore protein YtfJ
MDLLERIPGMKDAASVARVFGEPIDRDGTTVIPVARVGGAGGWGGGGSGAAWQRWMAGMRGKADDAGDVPLPGEADDASAGGGFGVGAGISARPAGVYVIRGGKVRWLPAVDANRAVVVGCMTAVAMLLVVRGLVRSVLASRG